MTTRVQDVITEEFVRDQVDEVVWSDLVYREVFQNITATGINSPTYRIYEENDNFGEPQVVAEGAEFPRDKSDMSYEDVHFKKYGDEFMLTMESQEDSVLDVKARQADMIARKMRRWLNDEAHSVLDSNISEVVGDANDQLQFNDVREGMMAVRANDYAPDTLILDIDGYGDLADQLAARETDDGDTGRRTGEFQQIAGMNPLIDNLFDIGLDNGSGAGGGAYVVDSEYFGYEVTRTPISTNQYTDDERQGEVMQIYTRKGWVVMNPEAGVKVNG